MTQLQKLLLVGTAVAALTASCSRQATTTAGEKDDVTLTISTDNGAISAVRDGNYVRIVCNATLRNRTDAPIVVQSNFHSAFDGLSVVVSTPDGRVLGRTAYVEHQAPQSMDLREFPLPPGDTTQELAFVSDDISADVSRIVIQLVGNLPRSEFGGKLESKSIELEVSLPSR